MKKLMTINEIINEEINEEINDQLMFPPSAKRAKLNVRRR